MQPEEVRIVKGVDERLTGEAYVHISGARAKLRLALAKDRTLMPVRLLHTLLVSHKPVSHVHMQADMYWQAQSIAMLSIVRHCIENCALFCI